MKRSPLAPTGFPALAPLDGVRLGAIETGVKYHQRDDLMLATLAPQTTVAGVLTQSATAAAPVLWCRRLLDSAQPRALIVNAGNANAFTGAAGARAVRATCEAVAAAVGCAAEQVLAASTGVIGEPLPVERIVRALPALAESLRADASAWSRAAHAITTTDTFAKGATARAEIAGAPVTINGFAKGSGMIEPDMATMLAFVFTDAAIPRATLQAMLLAANAKSFNAITVDGDTSTSDTCLLFATGCAAHPSVDDEAALADFRRALEAVMTDLAVQIVRDGEGASKLIRIEVRGARDDDARAVAKSIANSPLVKTAIAGGDANWGRIVMAIGKSGVAIDPSRIAIAIGGVPVTADGQRVDDYDEAPVNAHLAGREIVIEVELGAPSIGRACVWTCDLTHGYIEINADYRS